MLDFNLESLERIFSAFLYNVWIIIYTLTVVGRSPVSSLRRLLFIDKKILHLKWFCFIVDEI